ncbi:MAG: ATPase, T2SS/T4P/T4SS family, partial [Microcystaceae cyanobacterium]
DRQGQKQLQNLVSSSAGLVLISGLAQGGQSLTSTLMTFIGQQVQRGMTVGSVEDPIRQAFDGITQMEVNLEDGLSPSHALNLLSGQGLEVLAVDHISDAETAQTVLQTANQGHLVFAG